MIEIFFSYAHEDESLMNEVRRQLIVYERNGKILKWYDRMIPAGTEWKKEIDQRLMSSKVILLFMSPSFIESKYCYEIEGQEALNRHERGDAIVIPVVLRPCAWQETPFSKLQALPKDANPITLWPNIDVASLDVALGVINRIEKLFGDAQK